LSVGEQGAEENIWEMKCQEADKHCIMRSFITCTLHQGNQIKENEMGGACSTYGENEKS
jgi:hypothetical protein